MAVTPQAEDRPQARIAVVLKGYPRLSETFIAQEILALERAGLALDIYSLRHPTDRERRDEEHQQPKRHHGRHDEQARLRHDDGPARRLEGGVEEEEPLERQVVLARDGASRELGRSGPARSHRRAREVGMRAVHHSPVVGRDAHLAGR